MSGTVGNNTNRGSGVVKSTVVGADSIDGSNIADDAIDSEHYTDGSIDNAHIADDAIDSEHYADGSIDNAHIADDAIDSEHYADGSIDEAHIADNAVTLAKMAGGTDGNIISFDASGDPVAIATGSDGQVLTSTGAGSPPAFETAAAGAVTKILTTTISSPAAAVVFNSTYVTSTYSYYKLVWEGISVDTTNDEIGILLSVDNGSAFATHVNMNEWLGTFQSVSSISSGWTGGGAYHKVHGDVHSDYVAGSSSGMAHIWNANSTTEHKFVFGNSCDQQSGGDHYRYESWTVFESTSAVNYIKIYDVNGNNLDAGKVTLYGFK